MKKLAYFILSGILIFSSCSTRKFVISSVPSDAMITITSRTDTLGKWGTLYFKNPLETKITFLGKSDSYRIIVDRRGYSPETHFVTRDSSLNIGFKMNRISDASDQIYDTTQLRQANYLFLPPEIDVTIRSGIGNMIKYKHSDELTKQAYDSINFLMQNTNPPKNISVVQIKSQDLEWRTTSTKLSNYLMKLNGAKLSYYSYAPEVMSVIKQDTMLMNKLTSISGMFGNPYLVFCSLRCIKESTGRIIGNIGAAMAGGVLSGYDMAYGTTFSSSYDPNAFTLDTGTKIVYFVIDSKTFEVVKMDQNYYGYDLTSKKQRPGFVKELLSYPKLKKK